MSSLAPHYYLDFAAAYVRGRLPIPEEWSADRAVEYGLAKGLRLHRFKRTAELPRVRKVLGILRGMGPDSLLDVGSGRGVFLWPLLDACPGLSVTAIDVLDHRVELLETVRRGGIFRLTPLRMDVTRLGLAGDSVDGITILEVLEHLNDPGQAVREATRVARKFVVASVPSKEDDNPEHIQLFTRDTLESLFLDAGARRVQIEGVLNHFVVVAMV